MSDEPQAPVPALDFTGKLAPQPWMTAPETRSVWDALAGHGIEARFVGGCVRDSLLHRPVKDIDLATPETPETVMAVLHEAGIRVIPTGIEHGTVTAVVGKAHYEITTLRHDVETYGRHARVAYTDDWRADAARRDFTINALYCTIDGDIYDPFGGLDDLGYGRVRFVGRATDRIDEDVLRLLRFFRFYAHYGSPPPDPEALAACRSRAPKLPTLSAERVRGEILRLLDADDAASVLLLMRGEQVLDQILPEATDMARLRMLIWLETRAIRVPEVGPDHLRRLAAVLDTDGPGAEAVGERLRLANRQIRRLVTMAAPPLRVDADLGDDGLRRALYRLGAEAVRDIALVTWAGRLAVEARLPRSDTDALIALLEATAQTPPIEFPLKGRDVLDLGVPKGPAVGRLLREVEKWWEDGGCRADRDACVERLRGLAKES